MPKIASPLPPLDAAQRYDVEEAKRYLRVSKQKLYNAIRDGAIATIKDGRRRYFPGSELIRLSRAP